MMHLLIKRCIILFAVNMVNQAIMFWITGFFMNVLYFWVFRTKMWVKRKSRVPSWWKENGFQTLGQRDSNPRMQESKSCALPLGDGPEHNKYSLTQEREIFNKKERKKYDMTHGEKAGALFLEGYNCAQSVVLAFADEMGIPKETAARINCNWNKSLVFRAFEL